VKPRMDGDGKGVLCSFSGWSWDVNKDIQASVVSSTSSDERSSAELMGRM